MYNSVRKFLVLFILTTIISCAVQVAPTGGPKDTSAPKIEKEIPENKITNFDRNEVKIFFNEFVILKSPEDQIVVSPPLDETPEYIVSGRVLKINFRGSFKKNTTYTINFGNAVTDNHEGNILENTRYVFATGSDLDTNKISGVVYNSFTAKPEKNIVIGLYDAETFYDSIIYKKKPEYFSKTKENGNFAIENIPDKKFILVGFNDDNKNLKYNKNEDLLFNSSSLNLNDTSTQNNKYHLFSPDTYKINRLLDTICKEKCKFIFVVYKPTNILIKPDKNISYYTHFTKTKNNLDTIYIISNELKNDSIVLFNINQPDTSYQVKLISHKRYKLPQFSVSVSSGLELNDTIQIFCSNPFKTIDTTRFIFKEDTICVKAQFIKDLTSESIKIYYPLKEKTKYSLLIKDSAFTDIFGQYNKKTANEISTKSIKDYSSLNLKILLNYTSENYIVQLINDDETFVFKEFVLNKTDEKLFEYLLPGNYKIKFIKDDNKNGKWDNGDYFLKRQPESVYYYPEVIVLKAYWDLDQLIDLNTIINK